MKKILGIGNALVDVVTFIGHESLLDELSLPKGSMQLVDSGRSGIIQKTTARCRRVLTSGGSAANTIHGLGMLGVETGFIGSVGDDATGDIFEADLKRAGVRTFLKRSKTPTGTAVALVTPDGERTFGTHLGAAIEISSGDIPGEIFDSFDILYLEGYLVNNMPLVIEVCSLARSKKMKVALDLASYNIVKDNLESFTRIVNDFTDILFANDLEAEAFTGQKPEKALEILSGVCEIAVIKTGEKGSWVGTGHDKFKINALPVGCIDTTGAGDLYASGFLYGLSHGRDMETCGRYGSLLAARVIGITGARMPEEAWSGIRNAIESI